MLVNLHHAIQCFTSLIHNMKCYIFSNRIPAGNQLHVTTARLTVDTIIYLIGKCKMTNFKLWHNCSILIVLGPAITLQSVRTFFLGATKHRSAEPLFTAFLFHLSSLRNLSSPSNTFLCQMAELAITPFVVACLPTAPFNAHTSHV